jgi:Flp pilus assembly pilin Flp
MKELEKVESGAAMTEYAIVFGAFALLFRVLINPMQDSQFNLIFGFSRYFSRITDFVGLPIP